MCVCEKETERQTDRREVQKTHFIYVLYVVVMCASVCMHAQDLTQENVLSFISNRTMVNKVSVKQRNIVEPDSIQGGNKVNENGSTEQDKYCTAGDVCGG